MDKLPSSKGLQASQQSPSRGITTRLQKLALSKALFASNKEDIENEETSTSRISPRARRLKYLKWKSSQSNSVLSQRVLGTPPTANYSSSFLKRLGCSPIIVGISGRRRLPRSRDFGLNNLSRTEILNEFAAYKKNVIDVTPENTNILKNLQRSNVICDNSDDSITPETYKRHIDVEVRQVFPKNLFTTTKVNWKDESNKKCTKDTYQEFHSTSASPSSPTFTYGSLEDSFELNKTIDSDIIGDEMDIVWSPLNTSFM